MELPDITRTLLAAKNEKGLTFADLGKVIGRARIVHRGGSIVFAEGELRDPDNSLLATSTQTLRIVTIQNVELDFGQGTA